MSVPSTIEEKKALIGGKPYFRFDGQDYKTRQEAEDAQRADSERRTLAAAADAQRQKVLDEQQKRHQAYATLPTYKLVAVSAETESRSSRMSTFGAAKNTGTDGLVDIEALSKNISNACRDLSIDGYEVISIIEVTSGIGARDLTVGWGYSFTSGVIITAKRMM